MRTALRIACTLAFVALVSALPVAAEAATKKIVIKPNALTPFSTQQNDTRVGVFSLGPGVFFWATLKIPVDAKITGLSYRRFTAGAAQTNVAVQRVQIGKTPTWQTIYDGLSTLTPVGPTGSTVSGTFVGATKKVQAGWDYFVFTYTASGTGIGDITVKYETP